MDPPTTEDGIPVVRGEPRLVSHGSFEDAPLHTARGWAYLFEVTPDAYVVRLERMEVSARADLYVYLSNDAHGYGNELVRLGRLDPTDDESTYRVPPGTDVSGFRSVIVWSESLATLIGAAPFFY